MGGSGADPVDIRDPVDLLERCRLFGGHRTNYADRERNSSGIKRRE